MRTALLLAYYFPPVGGAGTQRALSLARHLPDSGWHPVVLTPQHGEVRSARWGPTDASLVSDDEEFDVRRVAADARPPSKLVSPQRRSAAAWIGPATAAADRILRHQPVDVLVATLSPFGLADVALRAGRDHDIPVVLDLRDPWALDGWVEYRSRLDWWIELLRMRRALRRTAAVVANTAEARRVLVADAGVDPDRVHVVTNGWSACDLEHPLLPERAPGDRRLTIVHTGSFHTHTLAGSGLRTALHHRPEPIDPLGRTPVPLVRALHRVVTDDPTAADDLHVVHVGTVDERTRAVLADAPVEVTVTGYLPHEASVGWLLAADVLFLPLHGQVGDAPARIVPGKTYEYLAAGRPILAAVPPGEARELALSVPGSVAADATDVPGLAAAIAGLLARHRTEGLPRERSTLADDYERATLASSFAMVLDVAATAGS